MPTKRIYQKLIRRATQILDPISELNPNEAMNDNRKKETEESGDPDTNWQVVND